MLYFPRNQSRLIVGLAILVALVLIASGCQGAQPGTPAPQAATEEATEEPAEEATAEATHEATEEATHEATAEATHEATEEATHEHTEEFEDLENPFAGDPDAIAAGQEIYLNNCALCHGETGMGDGPAAPGLPEEPAKFADCEWQSHEPDGELFNVIVNGEPEEGMPAWGETLTEDQIWQVLSYERSFCPDLVIEAEATHEATAEATHEATAEATHEATAEATHEATAEATHEASEEFEDLENPFAGDPDAIAAGKEIYQANCALCHGETGMGDGPAAPGLPEEPAKFADCEWQSHEPDGELFHVIVNGEPEEGMPAWGETLTEDQIWQVLSYERSFCPDLEIEAEATHEATAEATHEAHEEGHTEGDTHPPEEHMAGHHDVPAEAAAVENPIPATEESIEKGRQLYAANCAICHGETGNGDGPAAAGLEKEPANLHEDHVQENSDGALFWIISHGKPDTPMPAWDNVLTEEERWHVVNFLRTFGPGE